MSGRNELISDALKERFDELLKHISRLNTAICGPMNFFRDVREKLSGLSPADFRRLIAYPHGLDYWTTSDSGCRRSLILMSLGMQPEFRPDEHPPVEPFMEILKTNRADPHLTYELLLDRYRSPLSFNLPLEEEIREYVLMRLMTQDRARAERGALSALEKQDLLLKLNLVAVHSARTPDLRFLDALNYYYELLPALRSPTGHDDSPLASYLALYGQALAARI